MLLMPIITILLCSTLLVNIGYAGFNSTVDVSENPVGIECIVIELTDDGNTVLTSGGFSSGINSITYSKVGSSYYIFAGERTLGSSKIVIDATQSNATSISLFASVSYELSTGGTGVNLPYGMVPEFKFRYGNSTGTMISDSTDITITPGEINTLYVEFVGKLNTNYNGSEPVNFVYDVMFEATSK